MYKYKKHIIVGTILALFLCILYRINIYSNINSNKNLSNDISDLKSEKYTSNIISKDDDYSILVSSPFAKALVSLDESNNEVTIKLLDKDGENIKGYDNYINVSDDDIKSLSNNSEALLNDFNNGSLFDKYSLVCDTLKNYDTDLSSGDLIKIAFMYMK